jgi:hypothetical protein
MRNNPTPDEQYPLESRLHRKVHGRFGKGRMEKDQQWHLASRLLHAEIACGRVYDEGTIDSGLDRVGAIDAKTDAAQVAAGRDHERVLAPALAAVVHQVGTGIHPMLS